MNLIQRVINLIKRALNPKSGEISSTTEKISPKTGEITPASGELAPEKKAQTPTPAAISPKAGDVAPKPADVSPKTGEITQTPKASSPTPREKTTTTAEKVPAPREKTATTAEKAPAPSIAPSEKKPEHILVRCASCGKDECVVECGKEALTHIYGDVLIETAKCAECGRFRLPVPGCVAECSESPEKTPLAIVSVEEKRKTAASALRYYSN